MQLEFPDRGVVVVAGVPGAGKTTLIDRAVDRGRVRVVDTEDQRRAGHARRPKPFRVAVHYARILRAVLGTQPAVIHSRGTTPAARRALTLLARLRGRPAHLLLVVASPNEAVAGQHARGRTIADREMRRHVERLAALAARPAEEISRAEGWAAITVVDRDGAAQIERLAFATPAVAPAVGRLMRGRESPDTRPLSAACQH